MFCKEIIEELLEDIDLHGLDEPCIVFYDKIEKIHTDYLLEKEFTLKDIHKTENQLKMTLFEALVLFINQHSENDRPLLSYKLLAVRNIAGLSQVKLAEKIGIIPQTYEKWEYGERTPKLENLKKIAEACEVDIKYLI